MRFPLFVAPRPFALAAVALTLATAGCTIQTGSDDEGSGGASGGSSGGGSSSTSSGGEAASECPDRCEALAKKCGSGTSACDALCARVTETQLACLERKACDESIDDCTSPSSSSSSSSTSSSSSSSSGSTSSSSSSGGPSKPTALTITGSFGSAKAIHVKSGTSIASSLTVAAKPTVSPTPSELPKVFDAVARVISPSLGACKSKPGLTLNSSQVSVSLTGSDELPSTDCARFTDEMASRGIELVIDSAKYPNGGETQVTLRLRP